MKHTITTKADMDRAAAGGCADPTCTHKHDDAPLYLHALCHISAPVEVSYYKGVMHVNCRQCKKLIVAVEVK